jgi:RNA polymerase sigma factor (sigma-70 family)
VPPSVPPSFPKTASLPPSFPRATRATIPDVIDLTCPDDTAEDDRPSPSDPVSSPFGGLNGRIEVTASKDENAVSGAAAEVHSRAPMSLQSQSVAALVGRAGEGDARAWEELVDRFGGMIAATGRRYRLTPADVAELQQTTWLRLVENLHKIEQPERVGGWLATTARRESLHLLRRASKYYGGADQILANTPDSHTPEPDARPIAEERDTVLRAARDRLKPRCQQLLSLLIADDPLGYKDLSQLLKMPVGSIGPTRGRCIEHLRCLIAEEGMSAI